MSLVFLDTETTGLDPRTEDVFEVAIIVPYVQTDRAGHPLPDARSLGAEHVYQLEPRDEAVDRMHPKAAEVNRYHERTSDWRWEWHDAQVALDGIRGLLDGVHICGAVPDFDARHLTALYRRFGQEPPQWHYHLIDVEALAVGYLHGFEAMAVMHDIDPDRPPTPDGSPLVSLPWKSDDLSRACGVEPPGDDERHTALGDARWCKRLYEAITGGDL